MPIEWHHLYCLVKIIMQVNTFQCVLITDSAKTYYVFTYVCGEMEWSGLGTEAAVVGFNTNGDFFHNHQANGQPDIGQIISCSNDLEGKRKRQATNPGNGGDTNSMPASISRDDCILIANFDDMHLIITNTTIEALPGFDQLPACPSTKLQLSISTEFQEFPPQDGDCYQSKAVTRIREDDEHRLQFVHVCCYDQNG